MEGMRFFVFALQWAEGRDKMEKAAGMLSLDGQIKKKIWGQFWSAHQVHIKLSYQLGLCMTKET